MRTPVTPCLAATLDAALSPPGDLNLRDCRA